MIEASLKGLPLIYKYRSLGKLANGDTSEIWFPFMATCCRLVAASKPTRLLIPKPCPSSRLTIVLISAWVIVAPRFFFSTFSRYSRRALSGIDTAAVGEKTELSGAEAEVLSAAELSGSAEAVLSAAVSLSAAWRASNESNRSAKSSPVFLPAGAISG